MKTDLDQRKASTSNKKIGPNKYDTNERNNRDTEWEEMSKLQNSVNIFHFIWWFCFSTKHYKLEVGVHKNFWSLTAMV